MSSVSPASSPGRSSLQPEESTAAATPYPLPFLVSSSTSATAASSAAPAALNGGAFPSSVHARPAGDRPPSSLQMSWDGPSSSSSSSAAVNGALLPREDASSPLIRFLPIAEPNNGPREALDRMSRLAQLSGQRSAVGGEPGRLVVSSAKYTTSADSRGYIPVLEFPLGEQVIMLDSENGLVHWTSIWKLLGNSKADMVRLVEMQPEVGALLKKVRGGYLKIQGTWLPYDIALNLARRVAYPIRHNLEPLFGSTFPAACLSPSQPGFGQITLCAPGTSTRRGRQKRTATTAEARRAPLSPRVQSAALPGGTSQHRTGSSNGPVRYNAPGADGRYAPYPSSYAPPPPPPPMSFSGLHQGSRSQPFVPASHGQTSVYPEASAQYYPPPPATARTDSNVALGAYRFPAQPASLPAQPPPSSAGAYPPSDWRPELLTRKSSSLSITQLLDGETPPDTPFSLPLPLVGAKFASPISGDQHQLSVLDGGLVPRRGSQQFKRLLGDRDDWTPPSTTSSATYPQSGYFRRDSLPSPLRTGMPGLSLSDRSCRSPPYNSLQLSSVGFMTQRLPPVDGGRDDDALSAHSSGVSSPRTADDAVPPVVIRTDSRDDTDDRTRAGSFNSTLGVFFGPPDGANASATAWGKAADRDGRFPPLPSSSAAAVPSFPIPAGSYATASRAADARRHSTTDQSSHAVPAHLQQASYNSSERSSLAHQSSLPSIQQSPLRPW